MDVQSNDLITLIAALISAILGYLHGKKKGE